MEGIIVDGCGGGNEAGNEWTTGTPTGTEGLVT